MERTREKEGQSVIRAGVVSVNGVEDGPGDKILALEETVHVET